MNLYCRKVLIIWFKMHPWVLPIIIGVIGILYLIFNSGAIIETIRNYFMDNRIKEFIKDSSGRFLTAYNKRLSFD